MSFAADLAVHGDRTAIVTADGSLTYAELAAQVAETARRLGTGRRLVLLAASNTLPSLIVYLAALAAGHPLLLVPAGRSAHDLVAAYDPDVVAWPDGELDERREGTAHELHPELALLLSTSGSTGSPKLVRLSHRNLAANATAIAEYLAIRPSDQAATTLPMSYCYGLSVINSHLTCGAALILTELSVSDPCFWELFRSARGTTFAGVPYTFDLLDRIGFDGFRLPRLRYVTQAGGRLPADQVRRYAALGAEQGWDLVVMYGQTEATARMAYLPPELAASRPTAIGVPIPGGAFRLAPLADHPEPGTGELLYSGPNVMLGYAETPADLALGRTVTELATGDIARRAPDGLYEVTGRRSRFAKIFGLRIDPDRIEAALAAQGVHAICAADDTVLVVAVPSGVPGRIAGLVAVSAGLPAHRMGVLVLPDPPRLPNGKPDHAALIALAPAPSGPVLGTELCELYARVLGRTDVGEDSSFVGLGGDSLSYVEMSLLLEERLGPLPVDWHLKPIKDLRPRASRRRTLETGVALRAVAIVLIVGTHISLFSVRGGAHLLLAVAGFNLARFQLTAAPAGTRRSHLLRSLTRIVLPSVAWIAFAAIVTDAYQLDQALLLHSLLARSSNYWFVELIVYLLVGLIALLSVPALDRAERRAPFAFPLALLAVGLAARFDAFDVRSGFGLPQALAAFWMFPLGWAAAKATLPWHRLLVTAVAFLSVPGYFGSGELVRETVILTGVTLLVWFPTLPSSAALNRLAGLLAGASLYIYLTHWQVYPLFASFSELLALLASLAFGVALPALCARAHWSMRRGVAGARTPRPNRSTTWSMSWSAWGASR
ncbi:AMP-binding protein [Actinocorallia lasiicapitis]